MPSFNITRSSAARAAWHRQLIASNLAAGLYDGSLTVFPQELLQSTRDYLAQIKLFANTDNCNLHLNELIADHVQKENGSLEIAILACTLEYSPFVAIAALQSLRCDNQENPSYTTYLRCLIVANTFAPRYVSDLEAQVAAALLQIRLGYADPLRIFRNMIAILSTIADSQMLPAKYINRLLAFCHIPESYQLHLSSMQSRCQFARLYQSVSWFEAYRHPLQSQLAREVLEAQIPHIEFWTSWKPDVAMLQKWENHGFTPQQLKQLHPVFCLEGPDVTRAGHRTFKEASPHCYQTVAVAPPDISLLLCLQQLLLRAMDIGPEAVDLLLLLCVKNTATDSSLSQAAEIIRIGDADCCKASMTLSSLTPNASVIARMMTLSRTLPTLQQHPALRCAFAGNVIDLIVPTMKEAQGMYKTQLPSNAKNNVGYRIHEYGRALKQAPWLNEYVPPEFLEGVDRFPRDDVFQAIMKRFNAPQIESVERVLKDYLLATLGGTGTLEGIAALRSAVDGELQFWITHKDVERNQILDTIRKLTYVRDMELLRALRQQILVEDIVLLRDLLLLIKRDSHDACINILRILARRIQLPMVVHAAWISLMLLMLQQRAEDLVAWSCENLPVADWFQFIADIRIVFAARQDQMATLTGLGFTAARLAWWQELQREYAEAVTYIDHVQRYQNGGIASMKWLYLQEIPHVQALLATIMSRKTLGYDPRWILSFFNSVSPAAVATLCNCLAAHDKSSMQGLYAVRRILGRYYGGQWKESATQAYLLAWSRSKDLTEDDKHTLTLLGEVMGIQPSMNPHGLNVIKNKMLKEYDGVIELARVVEGLRIRLSRRDSVRTNELARRIGMQGTLPYIDPDIPESLSDAVECVGPKQYELCFPLTHLQGHDRKARGMGSDSSPILSVRVMIHRSLNVQSGFCVHLVPHETVHKPGQGLQVQLRQQAEHTYWYPAANQHRKPTDRICTGSLDLFTYALSQRLHRHFLNDVVSLRSIYDITQDAIKRPGAQCMACGDPLHGQWTPTICNKYACVQEMSRSSTLVRAYSLLVDAPVLDFLLGCLYAAASDTSGLALLPRDCPFEKTRLIAILDSFPALPDEGKTPAELLNTICSNWYLANDRRLVLVWMSKWFRGCMLSAPQGKRLSIMSGVTQFLLFNSTPEFENAVVSSRARATAPSSSRTGDVVFHGSQASRMWKVLTEGLRNMSNTQYMAHGAANGPGIYTADEPATSFSYSGLFSTTWSNSAFRDKKVLLGCELIKDNTLPRPPPGGAGGPPVGTHIVTDESRVLVRYVFICPSTYTMPPARHIDQGMQSTFAALRSGASL